MKSHAIRKPVLYFMLGALCVHLLFLVGPMKESARIMLICWPLNATQRRLMILPGLYPDVLRLNSLVPSDATLWYVAPYMPHYILYHIYPRKIKWGSPNLADRMRIHKEHPHDWVMSDETYDNRIDRIHLIPPDSE